MTTLEMLFDFASDYTNIGQKNEQKFRFALTGERLSADNLPATAGADVLDIQIKSAKATICKGRNLEAHLTADKANRFAYVLKDGTRAYIMNRTEYTEFVAEFGYITTESQKNGGAEKIRLKDESKKMVAWLVARA